MNAWDLPLYPKAVIVVELSQFAELILTSADLKDKLVTPSSFSDSSPHINFVPPSVPARSRGLAFEADKKRVKFPTLAEMQSDLGRARVFHFFANHELLALELMALALLRFPDAPPSWRKGLAATMVEEQRHLQLYLARMEELGLGFGEVPVNDFFWRTLSTVRDPLQFIAGMSLTFEQANLDFSVYYRDLFQKMEDLASAELMQKVYDEEIGHVKHGAVWFDRLRGGAGTFWQDYARALPFPLTPSRAKGMIYCRQARERAGLGEAFMNELELYPQAKAKPATVFWYNPDCEQEIAAAAPGYEAPRTYWPMITDLAVLPLFLAQEGDVICTPRRPSFEFLREWQVLGAPRVFFAEHQAGKLPDLKKLPDVKWDRWQPWGFSPRAVAFGGAVRDKGLMAPQPGLPKTFKDSFLPDVFSKFSLPRVRRKFRESYLSLLSTLGPELADGELLTSIADVEAFRSRVASELGLPIVVKAPFSAAGQGAMRLRLRETVSASQAGWMERVFGRFGAVLAEPWLQKACDISFQFHIGETINLIGPTRFFTDNRGQYLGHVVGMPWHGLTENEKRALLRPENGLLAVAEKAAREGAAWLQDQGFRGNAGLDTFVYHHPSSPDSLRVQIIGEINSRLTMGLVAIRLGRFLTPGAHGAWLTLGPPQLEKSRFRDFSSLYAALRKEYPLCCSANLQKDQRIDSGVIATNDASQAKAALGILAVGEEAVNGVLRFLDQEDAI